MATSDYTVTATSIPFCPNAALSSAIAPLTTVIPITGYRSAGIEEVVAGEAAMINDEIVRIESFSPVSITVARGCADTIPQAHAAGSTIWFFDDSFGNDAREYAGSETIAVKLLPKTASAQVPIANSTPANVTFNFRFARPYAPGKVEVDGEPFTAVSIVGPANPALNLTWAHRDRVSQFDQLIDHSMSSVGPEAGTTYVVKVYKADNTLVRTVSAITGTSWGLPLGHGEK